MKDVDGKAKLKEKLFSSIEKQFDILGISAVEDTLEENIKPVISKLRSAGIKIWILTGDDSYTSLSIAYSCGLIEKDWDSFVIDTKDEQEIQNRLEKIESRLSGMGTGEKTSMVITGKTISALDPQFHSELIRNITSCAIKVGILIASRVSPAQKKEVLMWLRENDKKACVLAIGDGTNDVQMLQSANVGIGIVGKSGSQAARAGDIIIGSFTCLQRLLFFHGTNFYRKNTFIANFLIFSSVLYFVPVFLFFAN